MSFAFGLDWRRVEARRLFAAFFLICVSVLPNWWLYALDGSGLLGPVPTDFCYTYLSFADLCQALSRVIAITALSIAIGVALLAAGKLPMFRGILAAANTRSTRPLWSAAVVAGSIIFGLPALLASSLPPSTASLFVLACWIPALIAIPVGFTLTFYSPRDAITLMRELGPLLLVSVLVVFLADRLGNLLWLEKGLVNATLRSVAWLAKTMGEQVSFNIGRSEISVGNFSEEVGGPCAGLYGIVLNAGAVTTFAFFMRPRVSLLRVMLFLPVVAVASWLLNVLRITILFVIGAHYSPELAVEGFHTHAGWLMFIGLSIAFFFIIDRVPIFHRPEHHKSSPSIMPARADELSAMTLPFLLFLLTSLIVPAFSLTPEMLYPLRAFTLGAALMYFAPGLPKLEFGRPVQSILAGILISVLWLAFSGSLTVKPVSEILPGSSGVAVGLWVFFRVIGTSLLVPIAEEMFFRTYAIGRIRLLTGSHSVVLPTLLSSALFAALHANFILAFVAGILFAGLYLRRGNVWDAILAHMVANAIIAAAAIQQNNFSII